MIRPKVYTVPEMINLVIRLLTERWTVQDEYWKNMEKRRDVNEAIMLLKDLKEHLPDEYIHPDKFGKAKEDD